MKITPDDPKLTAYALGELDKSERAAIEAELEKSFACQQAVEEIREMAASLKKKLATEEMPELAFAQQRKIENQLKQSAEKPRTNWWRILFYGGLSTAAACLIAAMFLPALSSGGKRKGHTLVFSENIAKSQSQPNPLPLINPDGQKQIQPETQTLDDKTKKDKSSSSVVATGSIVNNSPTASANADGKLYALSGASPLTPPEPSAIPPNSFDTLQPTEKPSTVTLNNSVALNGANTFAGESGGRVSRNRDATFRSVSGISTLSDIPISESESFRNDSRYHYYAPGNETTTYPHLIENSFLTALNHPLSTFSIDVDTASYANVRRFLNEGRMPPQDAVRIEEMINYFKYDYPQPRGEDPFSANIEIAGCPWNSAHRLVRIGLKGREIAQDKRPPSNFVFLIDVSGSMMPPERLPLIKQALHQLVKKMTENDRVAIVVYASAAGVRLPSTSCTQKEKILEAIDELGAGGSTAGAAGIQAAYEVAQENFIKGGVNRVLLCTDGDFNVGMTDQNQLVRMIEEKAKSGVFLTTLGVGTDNYKDALMQKLADKGNGNYAYLDSLEEAQKVLIDQMSGTLVTIAKDVKIQVEFNSAQVGAYRLIGYEKRMLRKEDFNNDKKDAGEIGAGHTVTALYEIVPVGEKIPEGSVDPLKYQLPDEEKQERYVATGSKELLTLKLRYKQPDGDTSKLLVFPVTDGGKSFERASTDFKFATAVAEFGMLLRDSEFKGNSSCGSVLELATEAKGADVEGYRSEFLTLVRKAQQISR
ncbi:MAG TPA: von Willebrand factor type A domain-containing protein [Methylomirabilota bacterium]|nr:von Willebrand factor type A domain-containing protein [Methylomirabilota bacterium]